jgi:hypothetical protein
LTFGPSNTNGVFLPTTQYFPEDPERFREILTFVYSDIARRLNDKEIALYDLVELVTGEQWFTTGDPQKKRGGFRQVYEFGAVPSGTVLLIPHNISGVNVTTTFTHIYGTAFTDFPDNRPIPYASASDVLQQIQIRIGATNIRITNGANAPNIVSGLVILEYLKN